MDWSFWSLLGMARREASLPGESKICERLPVTVDILAGPEPGPLSAAATWHIGSGSRTKIEIKRITVENVSLAHVRISKDPGAIVLRVGQRTARIPLSLDGRCYTFLGEQQGSSVVVHLYRNRDLGRADRQSRHDFMAVEDSADA